MVAIMWGFQVASHACCLQVCMGIQPPTRMCRGPGWMSSGYGPWNTCGTARTVHRVQRSTLLMRVMHPTTQTLAGPDSSSPRSLRDLDTSGRRDRQPPLPTGCPPAWAPCPAIPTLKPIVSSPSGLSCGPPRCPKRWAGASDGCPTSQDLRALDWLLRLRRLPVRVLSGSGLPIHLGR